MSRHYHTMVSWLILLLTIITCNTSNTNLPDIHQLNKAAYNGDISRIIKLVEKKLDWTQLYSDSGSSLTAIHHALRGRHDSLATQSLWLIGKHEDVIDYLISRTSLHTLGCPLYYAAHYRNVKALDILLKVSDGKDILDCLTSQDVNGDTALHAAARSKAAGFARFYAKLLVNNSQILSSSKQVLQLLDLKYKKSLQLNNLSFEDLTSMIGHSDLMMITTQLGEHFYCKSILDSHHNTILHIAAASGRLDLVRMLMTVGCPTHQLNIYGLSPKQMAVYSGNHQIVMELQSQSTVPTLPARINKCENKDDNNIFDKLTTRQCYVTDYTMSQYLDSGWYNNHYIKKQMCDISTYHFMDVKDFEQYHYPNNQPAVFKAISLEWPAWANWKKNEFITRYGKISVRLSDIPYAELYGFDNKYSTTLSQFIHDFDKLSELKHPPYLFDAHVLQQYPRLASDVPVPKLLSNFSISLSQFILGPKGSGSPPHFHRDAINGLVYGVKHWYLWPPNKAFFSIQHVQDWISHHNNTDVIECIQLPGDVLYIPDNWGHAVINEEHSIGFAYEFQ